MYFCITEQLFLYSVAFTKVTTSLYVKEEVVNQNKRKGEVSKQRIFSSEHSCLYSFTGSKDSQFILSAINNLSIFNNLLNLLKEESHIGNVLILFCYLS